MKILTIESSGVIYQYRLATFWWCLNAVLNTIKNKIKKETLWELSELQENICYRKKKMWEVVVNSTIKKDSIYKVDRDWVNILNFVIIKEEK